MGEFNSEISPPSTLDNRAYVYLWMNPHADASYLALAEALDGSVLIAGDAALVAHAVGSLGRDRVRSVG
jgi:predicted nucleic acid-binding protein